jgi:hypothetical protein
LAGHHCYRPSSGWGRDYAEQARTLCRTAVISNVVSHVGERAWLWLRATVSPHLAAGRGRAQFQGVRVMAAGTMKNMVMPAKKSVTS